MNTPCPRAAELVVVLIVGVLALLSLSGCDDAVVTPLDARLGQPPTGADIVTLQVGNEWTYRRTDENGNRQEGDITTRVIAVDDTSAHTNLFQLASYVYLTPDELVYYGHAHERFFNDGRVYQMIYRWEAAPLYSLINPDKYAIGDTLNRDDDDSIVWPRVAYILDAKDQTVTTPAGTFVDCYVVKRVFDNGPFESWFMYDAYKPGIGHIRTLEYTVRDIPENGPRDTTLTEIEELIDYHLMPLTLP